MKTQLLSLLAGTALIATVSVAQAGAPMALSESQMDQVTAGTFHLTALFLQDLNIEQTGPSAFTLTLGGPHSNVDIKFD